jgi:hypothetical protein
MKRKNEATDALQRLTSLARAGNAGSWSWEQLRSEHFPARTDEASQRKLAEWARRNGVDWRLQPETVRVGKSRRIRVVVLLEPAQRFDKRR